ncbi:hypothetical protein V2J09_017795 [Rumex salicifolius]
MGSIGRNSDGTKPYQRKSDVDNGDTQHLEFDSQRSPHSGEANDDIFFGLQCLEKTQPLLGDTQLAEDAFETQCLDFDAETQLLDLTEETQVVDFGEETQLLDNEGDYGSDVETQLLSDPDDGETVGGSDGEHTIGTEVLNDIQDSDETKSIKGNSAKALGSELMQQTSICIQEEVKSKSAGSVRRGFTSIRTASLRASGLSARKKTVKDVESRVSDHNGVESSARLCDEAVYQESVMGKTYEHLERESSYDTNTKLRSTARELLLNDIDMVEHGHKGMTFNVATEEDCGQVQSCTNDLAGLSFINSQEPGDLSQATALNFVDQFLKENVCDFDLAARQQHVSCENQIPMSSSAKGTQKLAKNVNRRSSLLKNGVYDWDNRLEDEGGGDFLSRNKELFFGKKIGAHKPLTEPLKPKHLRLNGRNQGSINKEGNSKNQHKTALGLAHSEPTITSGRKLDQLEKLNIRRDLNGDFEKQVETEAIGEILEAVGVGVDTQMAAEAIETLSKGISLPMDSENAIEGEEREFEADLGVTTRSKRIKQSKEQRGDESKHSVASHPYNGRKRVVKGKAISQIENTVQIAKDLKGVTEKRTSNVKEKVKNTARKRNVYDNGSSPAKKRCVEKKINYVAPIASRTRNVRRASVGPANTALELSDNPKTKTEYLTVTDTDGNKRTRKNAGIDALERTLRLATLRDGIHKDECNRRSVQNRSDQLSENTKSKGSLEESAKQDLGEQSITKKRRSNTSVLPRKQFNPTFPSNEHDVCTLPSAENTEPERVTQGTPQENSSVSACVTPVNLKTPIVTSSPVCMGDEYYKLSCNTNLTRSSLRKELNSLTPSGPKCISPDKGLRKRRDMASIKVLFSHHLNEDIIRQQKKILARLGIIAVSSVSDATHFVAEEFVRTRNMLEAIAHGKPVVNYLWLERCGQAGCYVDEKKYLLRDTKKEKELGFNMPDSLSRASQHPLLEGKRVLITPNTMPGVDILSSLVKAVHGQALERMCRSIDKGDKVCSNLIVLSCEEDYEFCLPLLKKGAEVYSSELLLNGIVTQKLEFERHRLFMDHVKKTRSTIWLKKGGKEFQPVSRHLEPMGGDN